MESILIPVTSFVMYESVEYRIASANKSRSLRFSYPSSLRVFRSRILHLHSPGQFVMPWGLGSWSEYGENGNACQAVREMFWLLQCPWSLPTFLSYTLRSMRYFLQYLLCLLVLIILHRYLLNPYIFLPTLALSTSSFDNTLTLLSIMLACQSSVLLNKILVVRWFLSESEKSSASLLALAFLVQFSLSSILLLVPLLLLLISDPVSRLASPRPFPAPLRKVLPALAEFLSYFAVLTLASTLVSGGWTWIPKTWGAVLVQSMICSSPCVIWTYSFRAELRSLTWRQIPVCGGTSSPKCSTTFAHSSSWFFPSVISTFITSKAWHYTSRLTYSSTSLQSALNSSESMSFSAILILTISLVLDMIHCMRPSSWWVSWGHSKHTRHFPIPVYSWAWSLSSQKHILVSILTNLINALRALCLPWPRFSEPYRDGTPSPSCFASSPVVSPSVAYYGNRECKFLLCIDVGLRMLERGCRIRLYMGGIKNSCRETEERMWSRAGIITMHAP